MEQTIKLKLATVTRETVITLAPAFAHLTEGIADIATFSHISPPHAQSEVKRTIAFTGNQILTVKQTSSHQVSKTDCNLGYPGRFLH
ncbi:hypothetical protein D3C80_1504900 [compost metagenome]